jgi:hypothetical protein
MRQEDGQTDRGNFNYIKVSETSDSVFFNQFFVNDGDQLLEINRKTPFRKKTFIPTNVGIKWKRVLLDNLTYCHKFLCT